MTFSPLNAWTASPGRLFQQNLPRAVYREVLYCPSSGLPGMTVNLSTGQRHQWGKNGANHTPNHAIQCPLCISASRQGRALQPTTTGFSCPSHHIPQHNRGVGGQIGAIFTHRILRRIRFEWSAKSGAWRGTFSMAARLTRVVGCPLIWPFQAYPDGEE